MMDGDMKNEADDSKKRGGKGTAKADSTAAAPATGSAGTSEQLIAL